VLLIIVVLEPVPKYNAAFLLCEYVTISVDHFKVLSTVLF